MLNRLRTLVESRGNHTAGLAPSASAARTLERESGIESETVQKFLARHEGIVEGRGTATGLRNMRDRFSKTVLVVDESWLASSEQMRGLLRIATTLRIPRVVLVGDEKQLGAVEAGKPFEQVRQAGMQTVVMDEILRQRDMELREAVRAVLAGEVRTAFEKLGDRVAQVEREDIGGEAAERWLSLSPEERVATGVIAPTRALRDEINETIRAQLITEGAVSGPARQSEKLVSRGLTDQRRDGAGVELLGGRHRDLQSSVQDPGSGQRRRARGGEGRLRAQHGLASRRQRRRTTRSASNLALDRARAATGIPPLPAPRSSSRPISIMLLRPLSKT